ncbi:MAG: hypothetical protein ACN4GZ_10565 [Acidimicrobiales bacterium]
MSVRLLPVLVALVLVAVGCGETEPGAVVIRVEGSVSSLVTTTPEATTTTTPGERTTTSLPGVDPGPCPPPGEVVIVALVDEVQPPDPCPVSTEGSIRFSNLTEAEVTVEWAGRQIRIAPQRSAVPPERVGEVLSPGLHAFVTSIEATPTVLVAAPETGFGSAQVGLRSFGGIRPGQRVTEVEEAIGLSIVVAERGAECTLGWVAGDPHSPVLALAADQENPLVLRAEAITSTQRTLSDVGIGTPVEDLKATYGDQLRDMGEGRFAFEPNESIDANYRLIFDTDSVGSEQQVVAMRIGRLGEVERADSCP